MSQDQGTETVFHLGSSTQPPATVAEPVRFHGKGGEYFGIWIVNLLLTILTLGIYSAWAKVRRLRYFYQHTELAGANFEYHGQPMAILKGRLIALALVLAYNFSAQVSLKLFGVVLLFVLLITPWMMRQAFRFRLHNSSYRGLRFSFKGGLKESYITFLGYGLFMLFTLYLAAPLFHQRMKQYQHGNSQYGQSRFSFDASVGQFFGAYAIVIGLAILSFVMAMAVPAALGIMLKTSGSTPDPSIAVSVGIAAGVTVVISMLLLVPLWEARTQNLIWNHTQLGAHRFDSKLSAWRLLGIYLGNFVLVALTLGLFMPWAAVRIARYRASALTVLAAGSVEDFAAQQQADQSATGEETAEFFDIDIGF